MYNYEVQDSTKNANVLKGIYSIAVAKVFIEQGGTDHNFQKTESVKHNI